MKNFKSLVLITLGMVPWKSLTKEIMVGNFTNTNQQVSIQYDKCPQGIVTIKPFAASTIPAGPCCAQSISTKNTKTKQTSPILTLSECKESQSFSITGMENQTLTNSNAEEQMAINEFMKKKTPLHISQFKGITAARQLRVVQQLQERLANDAVVVIFGAPGSGKTEQMELALQGKPYFVFDLRNKFFNDYYQKNNITDAAAQADLKKKYGQFKGDERIWLEANKQAFADELINSKDNIIVFDEFDMSGTFAAGTDELESAKMTLEIAHMIRQKNSSKKIIFIIHDEGLGSEGIAQAMNDYFGIAPLEEQVIRTGYISTSEEKMLLKYSKMTETEQIDYMNLMMGHPSAYLPLINKMARKPQKEDLTYATLVQNTKATIKKVYAVMQRTQPGLIPVFKEIAQGNMQNAQQNRLALINSGFVNINMQMSEITKQVVLEQ